MQARLSTAYQEFLLFWRQKWEQYALGNKGDLQK